MKLGKDDEIASVKLVKDEDDILISTYHGKCLRINSANIRLFKGRSAKGVKGINIINDDKVISLTVIKKSDIDRNNKIKNLKDKNIEQLKEKHPDWELGNGKGLSLSVLKNAIKSGVKPSPKKRINPYFDFLAIVRKEFETQLSPRQIIRIGSCRWQVLKQFAAENGHSSKDVVKSEELMAEVSKNFATVEEDLKDMPEKKSKK